MPKVKFKSCWRCEQVKTNPLEKNFISPEQDQCPQCEREMLTDFVRSLDYDVNDIFDLYRRRLR